MKQDNYLDIIRDQTERALWEVGNIINCIPDSLWRKCYCCMPMWKHVYHMLHSLDLWLINPRDNDFREPPFHEQDLNNLDVPSEKELSKDELVDYYVNTKMKILDYFYDLPEGALLQTPSGCEYTRFTLILAQHRHLHSHMGMIMGFIIQDTGLWPRVIGLEQDIPTDGTYDKYF